MRYIEQARDFLAAQHEQLPGLLLMLTVWASMWALRRYRPKLWAAVAKWGPEGSRLSHVMQALPSVILGAALAALASGGDAVQAVSDALFAAIAPLWHHLLKQMPGPYRGSAKVEETGPDSRETILRRTDGPE